MAFPVEEDGANTSFWNIAFGAENWHAINSAEDHPVIMEIIILAKDFYDALRGARLTTKIILALEKLMRLAA